MNKFFLSIVFIVLGFQMHFAWTVENELNACIPIFEKLIKVENEQGFLSQSERHYIETSHNHSGGFYSKFNRYLTVNEKEEESRLMDRFGLKENFTTSFMSRPVAINNNGTEIIIQKGIHDFELHLIDNISHRLKKIIKKISFKEFITDFVWDLENKRAIGKTFDGKILLANLLTGQQKVIGLPKPQWLLSIRALNDKSYLIETQNHQTDATTFYKIFSNGKLSKMNELELVKIQKETSPWEEWLNSLEGRKKLNRFDSTIKKTERQNEVSPTPSSAPSFPSDALGAFPLRSSDLLKVNPNQYLAFGNFMKGIRIIEAEKGGNSTSSESQSSLLLEGMNIQNSIRGKGNYLIIEANGKKGKEFWKLDLTTQLLEPLAVSGKAVNLMLHGTSRQYSYHVPTEEKMVWKNLNTGEEKEWVAKYPDLYSLETLDEIDNKKFVIRTAGGRTQLIDFEATPPLATLMGNNRNYLISRNFKNIWVKDTAAIQIFNFSGQKIKELNLDTLAFDMMDVSVGNDSEMWLFSNDGKKVTRFSAEKGTKKGEIVLSEDNLEVRAIRKNPQNNRILVVYSGGLVKSVDLKNLSVFDLNAPEVTLPRGSSPSLSTNLEKIYHSKSGQSSILSYSNNVSFFMDWEKRLKVPFPGDLLKDSSKNFQLDYCPDEQCVLIRSDRTFEQALISLEKIPSKILPAPISGIPQGVEVENLRWFGWNQKKSKLEASYWLKAVGDGPLFLKHLVGISAKDGKVIEHKKIHPDWEIFEQLSDNKFRALHKSGKIKDFEWSELPEFLEPPKILVSEEAITNKKSKLEPKSWLLGTPTRIGAETWRMEGKTGAFLATHPIACIPAQENSWASTIKATKQCVECEKTSATLFDWIEKQNSIIGAPISLKTYCRGLEKAEEAEIPTKWPFPRLMSDFKSRGVRILDDLHETDASLVMQELLRLQTPKNWIFPEDIYFLSSAFSFIYSWNDQSKSFESRKFGNKLNDTIWDDFLKGAMQSLRVVNSSVYAQISAAFPFLEVPKAPLLSCRTPVDVRAIGQKLKEKAPLSSF